MSRPGFDQYGHPIRRPNLREQNPYLPERFYKIPDFLDTRNPEMKVIAALLGHKPTPVQKLERKEDTSSTVTKDNQSFQDYLERLQPSDQNELFSMLKLLWLVDSHLLANTEYLIHNIQTEKLNGLYLLLLINSKNGKLI